MDQQHALQGKKYGLEQALTDEQRKALEELGMIWDHNQEKWEQYYSAAEKYYSEHGNLDVKIKYVTPEGIPLGRWLSNISNQLNGRSAKNKTLTDEQLKRLETIGYRHENKKAIQWNRKFELAKAYYSEHGNLNIPLSYSVDGVRLGEMDIKRERKKKASRFQQHGAG